MVVIEAVVWVLPQNMDPPSGIDKVELPQLFTTVTIGAAGIGFGSAIPLPAALIHPLIVLVTV